MKNLICFLFVVFTSSILFGNTTPEPQSVSVIAFSGLKIRATPGVDGKVLDVVAFGEKVEILEDSEITQTIEWLKGKWIKVAYHNVEGYVFDGFVTKFPIPTYDFELTQNDLDIAYPLLAWAENNFDEINSMDTIERANSIKVIQYLEGGIQISREDTDYKFESVVTLPNTKISDGYNLVKSMLLTKNERKVFEDKSVFISNRGNEIDKIKIDVDAPIEIKDIGDGSIKISVVSFHEGCGL